MWNGIVMGEMHAPAIEGHTTERLYYESVSCNQTVNFGPKYYESKTKHDPVFRYIREHTRYDPMYDPVFFAPTGPEA